MNFTNLLGLLPSPSFPSMSGSVAGLAVAPSQVRGFVEPEVSAAEKAIKEAQIVIVAAPAAVGKTTLAQELAARSGALYWDLSKEGVSANAFVGMITNSFGWANVPRIHSMIMNGSALFVLDALDEAVIHSGFDNFVDFVRDISKALTGAPNSPQVVLLGRTEAATLAELALSQTSTSYTVISIEFFDRPRADAFIDARLNHLYGKESSHRGRDSATFPHNKYREFFEAAREQLYANAAAALGEEPASAWSQASGRRFLGYAPVLQAFADFLKVGDHSALIDQLKQPQKGSGHGRWGFLMGIIDHLISREQTKVQDAVRTVLSSHPAAQGWNDNGKLYGHDEQLARICSLRAGTVLPESVIPSMNAALRALYEERIHEQVTQHPFLGDGPDGFASVVFRDYVVAWALTATNLELADAVRTYAVRSPVPSPLVARFAFELNGDGEPLVCSGADVGVLFDSLVAGASSRDEVGIEVEPFMSGDDQVEFRLSSSAEVLTAKLTPGSELCFYRTLSNANIVTERTVRLGMKSGTFILGPDVRAEASVFDFGCDSLTINSQDSVLLRAASPPSNSPTQIMVIPGQGGSTFHVAWPRVGHPWARHSKAPRVTQGTQFASHPKWGTLRKLLLMFRRQRSRSTLTVLNARWSHHELTSGARDELLRLAHEHGVLREDGIYTVFEATFAELRDFVASEGTTNLRQESKAFVKAFLP